MVYKYKEKSSNIEDYLNKTVNVKEVRIDKGDNMTITELVLDNNEVISTTSTVIARQSTKLQSEGNIPFVAKIVQKRGGGGYQYYAFAEPDAEPYV